MDISYDKEVDAISITLCKGTVDDTIEIAPDVFLDVDKKKRPLYLEILDASKLLGQKATKEVSFKSKINILEPIFA